MTVANTLAYQNTETITVVKSFIVLEDPFAQGAMIENEIEGKQTKFCKQGQNSPKSFAFGPGVGGNQPI